jgi:SAM-dependent methyltransferase
VKQSYRTLARHVADVEVLFLNYGLLDPALPTETLRATDEAHRRHFDLLRKAIGPVPIHDARVVEAGCGRGGNGYYLARYHSPRQVVGVDPERANLKHAALARREGVTLIAGRAEALPLADASCDVVLSMEASHCYENLPAFLREAHRVLRPGGSLCLADIWDLELLGLDWNARQRAIDASPFRIEADEDISEQVFLALAEPGGLLSWLPRRVDASNRDVVERLARDTEAVRAHLAAGACRYRSMRFARP